MPVLLPVVPELPDPPGGVESLESLDPKQAAATMELTTRGTVLRRRIWSGAMTSLRVVRKDMGTPHPRTVPTRDTSCFGA
jgi:hypothetical protein